MADLVMGAMGNLIPKLYQLLEKEYDLQTGVKDRIRSLTQELEAAQAVLHKVAEVPLDQLDEEVKLWARHVREASYDMEDILDTFLVRVQQGPDESTEKGSLLKQPLKSITNMWKKSKARHEVSGDVKDIMAHLQEVTERCRRYKVENIVAMPATASTVDPRLHVMYNKMKDLVGIDKSSGELITMLQPQQQDDDASDMKMKVVSIVGVGGLGKTTLAKAVYDKIKGDFNCGAFVPIGRNPDLKKVFKDILIDLDRQRYSQFSTTELDERNLIDEIRNFLLEKKRSFLVIDDVWEIKDWETIKLAINDDNNCGGRIVITTRNLQVAKEANEIYKLQPLPYDCSRDLFYSRISGGHERGFVGNQPDDLTNKILSKCDGIPLAIITMTSLLAGKQTEEWSRLYKSIGCWIKDTKEAENTMKILSFSYYDLPSHLKTCLLYLSAFPEDSIIWKESLVWMWAAEGFVHEKEGISLFEIGEEYFNDLMNRSMIQPVESNDHDIVIGCRVHDMVLDFIRAMSCEEKFFTVLDSDHGTLIQSNARRVAQHYRTIGLSRVAPRYRITELSPLISQSDMKKVRSFIALECSIERMKPPLSSFTLLRVLAIEKCRAGDFRCVRVEHIGHLLHLRFLSLRETWVKRIPEEEIGALRFLQTLDLRGCHILEFPSCSSLSKRLACLHISLDGHAVDGKVFSVYGMSSLEELSILVERPVGEYGLPIGGLGFDSRWLLKGLGCLGELRVLVLDVGSTFCNEEGKRDVVEALRHLHKLQRLGIKNICTHYYKWQGTELVLPRQLQLLSVSRITFLKLPSCINPSCLSHLDLCLDDLDDQDLKMLGGLPELCFLLLESFGYGPSATISNISDSDACYFPKLRYCRLPDAMVLFIGSNKEGDKSVSFHIWRGSSDIAMPPVSDDELKSDAESEHSPMPAASVLYEELDRPLQRQHGLAALLAYYLLAFFQHVLEFIKKWSLYQVGQHPFISNRGCAPIGPSVSDVGEKKISSICSSGAEAALPRFMPRLEVLRFRVPAVHSGNQPNCYNHVGWKYLSSLREIEVDIRYCEPDIKEKMKGALRHTAQVHPNRPTLRFEAIGHE